MNPVDGPEVPPSARAHVTHAITHLLRPDELESWSFRWKLDDDSDKRSLVVDVVAVGEPYMGFLYEDGFDYPIDEALDIFTDGLEDFIAVSRFAWGQQRLLVDRPWRTTE